MTDRIIRNTHDLEVAIRFVESRELPITISVRKGADRTVEQNKLQRMWLNEIADQLDDQTAEEWRGYCKLRFGVPIMRESSEEFREKYDRLIKPMPYETKIELMMEPMDFPVTRIMTTKEKARYLDAIWDHFTGQGLMLTEPKR
jgi:hypothetical protein